METFIKISPIVCALFGGLITWLITRPKQLAEIEKIRSEKAKIDQDHIQGIIKMWQGLVEDLTADVKELTTEVSQLRDENKMLKLEMRKLEKTLNEKSN